MQVKPLVGISSCLLGENVRYNGEVKLNPAVKYELGERVSFFPVCPETESGMPVPREPMDLFEVNGVVRMITLESQKDKTEVVSDWIESKLKELSVLKLCGFVFKARSPSCAINSAKIHIDSRIDPNGEGLFAKAFMERFPLLPVEEEGRLQNAVERDRFLKKVFLIHQSYSR